MQIKHTGGVKKGNPVVFGVLREMIRPFLYLLYGFKFERKTAKGIYSPCCILANHQTIIDQFAVSMGFNFSIHYVGSDTLFRYGFKSWLMKILVRPIPFSKGNSDMTALKNIMSVIREGGCVGMFPSGNRSFYGTESTIVPGVGKLIKKLKAPLVLVQLRGGFFTKPRWMAKPSRGTMRAYVTRVVSPKEQASMSYADIDRIIQQELCFDDYAYNRTANISFHGRRRAEYIESVLFYCPQCSNLESLCSEGCDIFCRNCNARVRINNKGFFEKITNAQHIPDTALAWSHIQLDYIKNYDFSGFTDKPVFCDDHVTLSIAERARKEYFLGKGSIAFFADRLSVCGKDFPFTETTMAVQGVRKLTIYHNNEVYAAEVPFRTNLVKYMICGYHLRNKALGLQEGYYGY